jgi:hypothetical protein
MPRLEAFAKYVCVYIRMLTSMYIRIGIGGAQMPRLANEYVCTYVCMYEYVYTYAQHTYAMYILVR